MGEDEETFREQEKRGSGNIQNIEEGRNQQRGEGSGRKVVVNKVY